MKAESGIGSRLRRYLAVASKSIRTFSAETGIPYRTLQDYLSDKRKPGADHLVRIAERQVDLAWLLTGKAALAPVVRVAAPDALALSPLGADVGLLGETAERAMANADAYALRYFERTRRPILPSQAARVVAYFSELALRTLVELEKTNQIEEMVKLGVSRAQLLNLLTALPLSDLDSKIDQLIGTANARTGHAENQRTSRQ